MTANEVVLWSAPSDVIVRDSVSDPAQLSGAARQLREREQAQIVSNLEAGFFEIATTYVWARTMALLKKQLSSLGMGFLGELLQRPDLDEYSEPVVSLSDSEAIYLARDLGVLTPTQTMRLLHSQEVVSHFSALDNDPATDMAQQMTREEAISCLRVCVQGVLGHEHISVAEDFRLFRTKLESETFDKDSPEITKLLSSPYFFLKTAVSILLSIFKTKQGAQLEHAARNAVLIISTYWERLRDTEKWQIGQAYASEFSEGRTSSVQGLHAVLLAVQGFDFVPENLRSTTFIQVANKVIAAHQGMNNFYNEPAPMRELANLGTSIPGPALKQCMTAVLCVKLGNQYGKSIAAQESAQQVISGLSKERWIYYFSEVLDQDRLILAKIHNDNILRRWIPLIKGLELDPMLIESKDGKALLESTIKGNEPRIKSIANSLFNQALGRI